MTRVRHAGLALALLGLAAPAAAAPRLVASTPPVHSLVAAVAGEHASLELLVPGARSPHAYALTPSDTRALARADAVFAAGGVTARFLDRPLEAVAGDAAILRMTELPGVGLLAARAGGPWPTDRAHNADDGNVAPEGPTDPHVWLDPHNAIAFTRAVGKRLAALDPDHADGYRKRAKAYIERLQRLERRIRDRLAPVRDRPYLVYHDAYQYFSARFGLSPAGAVTVDPGRPPGAQRVSRLRERIAELGIRCLFVEPQFEPAIARTIVRDTGARIARLDPLGANLEPGPGLYPKLIRNLAKGLRGCLQRHA